MSSDSAIDAGVSAADEVHEFVVECESRLRHSLCALLGSELGHEAAAEALAYGWEHWDRVSKLDNPAGYLFKVGRNKGRRIRGGRQPVLSVGNNPHIPDFEPGLPSALADLSNRQRVAVLLVHSFEWSFSEVADHLGVSKSFGSSTSASTYLAAQDPCDDIDGDVCGAVSGIGDEAIAVSEDGELGCCIAYWAMVRHGTSS